MCAAAGNLSASGKEKQPGDATTNPVTLRDSDTVLQPVILGVFVADTAPDSMRKYRRMLPLHRAKAANNGDTRPRRNAVTRTATDVRLARNRSLLTMRVTRGPRPPRPGDRIRGGKLPAVMTFGQTGVKTKSSADRD